MHAAPLGAVSLSLICAMSLVSEFAAAADYKRGAFGKLADGRAVEAITLSNAKGIKAEVITYGAALQALVMPDRKGKAAGVEEARFWESVEDAGAYTGKTENSA